jgi:hypothetical protein
VTDRELLELAAKSFEVDLWPGCNYGERGLLLGDGKTWWNPLTDGNDAFLLAVKLKMTVDVDYWRPCVQVRVYHEPSMHHIDEHGDDPYAATRRAIVRAAAEIGRKSA